MTIAPPGPSRIMLKQTALHADHVRLGAKLVDFAGWDMPIQYASQLDEHHAVRQSAGMFDVAHMSAIDLHGTRTREFLRHLLANDVAKLKPTGTAPADAGIGVGKAPIDAGIGIGKAPIDAGIGIGKALYSCMLNPQAGVIDDLIVYFVTEDAFRLVVNAGTTDKDLAWIRQQAAAFAVDVRHRSDLGILAVQGPDARAKVDALLPSALRSATAALTPFSAAWSGDLFVGRTGYSGEDGYELILPHADLVALWGELLVAGVKPCGLGARDTLRLEAGMNLYGQDMDESVSPIECGLAWTVSFADADRDFMGRTALEAQRESAPRKAVSLVLEGRGVLRAHMPVRAANGAVGETTSGGYAPTMKGSIAMARMPGVAQGPYEVEVRGQWLPTREVKAPFVRHGKVLV